MRRALALSLLLTGCVQLTDTNPVGRAASISGSWTIDGEEPSSTLCDRLGASRMRVTFLDGLRPVPHPGLFFQCDVTRPVSGEPGFDTRDASGAVVEQGCWRIRTDALDSGGTVVAIGTSDHVFVPGDDVNMADCMPDGGTTVEVMGEHIGLPPTDFLSGELRVWTTIGGSRAGEASCEAEGIEDVTLTVTPQGSGRVDGLGEAGVAGASRSITQPCSLGLVVARLLPGDTYDVSVTLTDASGTMVGAPLGGGQLTPTQAGDLCYPNGVCRSVCAGGCPCVDGHCRPDGAADVPTFSIGG